MAIQQSVQEPVASSEVVIEANPSIGTPTPVSSAVSQTSGRYPKMGSFWERFIATLLDSIILGLVTAPFYAGSMGSEIAASVNTQGAGAPTFTGTQAMLQLLSFVIAVGYQVFFLTTKGQTLGKMIMKLKVLDEDNLSKLTVTEVIIRELGKLLSNITLSLGYMWYLIDPKKQTWHDRFSKSLVVKTDDQGVVLMTGNPPYAKNRLAFGGFYGGCCLLMLIMTVIGFIALSAVMKEGFDAAKQQEMESSGGEYDYDYNSDTLQDSPEPTSGDTELDFEEMLRLYNEQMDEAGSEPVPTEDLNQVN